MPGLLQFTKVHHSFRYEGTTQLQAVAAIKGVTTGVYLEQIKNYDSQVNEENKELQKILQGLTSDFEKISVKITEAQNNEVLDFHSRRLVEMAGNIIMDLIRSENQEKYHYMDHFDFRNLDLYKIDHPQLIID